MLSNNRRSFRVPTILRAETTSSRSYTPNKSIEEHNKDYENEEKTDDFFDTKKRVHEEDEFSSDEEDDDDHSDDQQSDDSNDDNEHEGKEEEPSKDKPGLYRYSLMNQDDRERAKEEMEKRKRSIQEKMDNLKRLYKERASDIKNQKNLTDVLAKNKEYQKRLEIVQQNLKKLKNVHKFEDVKRETKSVDKKEESRFSYIANLTDSSARARNVRFEAMNRDKAQLDLAETEPLRSVEDQGTIKLDKNDIVQNTYELTQKQILEGVDINSQKKVFDITLNEYSPYILKYTASGRKALLAGKKGHHAAFDWRKFDLGHEEFMLDRVHDAVWMMDDSMYALAQDKLVYVYNDHGAEIHRVNDFKEMRHLEYLPYHFLLVGAGKKKEDGEVIYKDISLGKNAANVVLKTRVSCMKQNPYNALICTGHPNGTVSLVTPKDKKYQPAVSIHCSNSGITSLEVDKSGNYMVVNSINDLLSVWDIRKSFEPVYTVKNKFSTPIYNMAISQTGMLAVACKSDVYIWKDLPSIEKKIYLKHRIPFGYVSSLDFCPYEDVLGIGYSMGVSSILVPGSGEANIDTRVLNPYTTEKQLRDFNVKSLLQKIPAEMISLHPEAIGTTGQVESDYVLKKKVKLNDELEKKLQERGIFEKRNEKKLYKDSSTAERRDKLLNESRKYKDERINKWTEISDMKRADPLLRFRKYHVKKDEVNTLKPVYNTKKIQANSEEKNQIQKNYTSNKIQKTRKGVYKNILKNKK